jgi:hypothetical protein
MSGLEEGKDEEGWRKIERHTSFLSSPDSYPVRLNDC